MAISFFGIISRTSTRPELGRYQLYCLPIPIPDTGQTITAQLRGHPSELHVLHEPPASCTFQGEVYAWDGAKASRIRPVGGGLQRRPRAAARTRPSPSPQQHSSGAGHSVRDLRQPLQALGFRRGQLGEHLDGRLSPAGILSTSTAGMTLPVDQCSVDDYLAIGNRPRIQGRIRERPRITTSPRGLTVTSVSVCAGATVVPLP